MRSCLRNNHQLIYVIRKKHKNFSEKTKLRGRSYRNYNRDLFENLLNEIFFEHFENPNEPWDMMVKNINDSIEELCPLKTFKINKIKEPWISNELIEERKEKDRVMKKEKKN